MDRIWQRVMDFRMLGILEIGPSQYLVGPWSLYGPAMERVRQTPLLRTALLVSNPKVPSSVKKMFAAEGGT